MKVKVKSKHSVIFTYEQLMFIFTPMEPIKTDKESENRYSSGRALNRIKRIKFKNTEEVKDVSHLSHGDILKLVNDLQIHQIELGVQNEEPN